MIRPFILLAPRISIGILFLTFQLPLQAANLPAGFAEVLVAQNLDPTAMALAPDGRIFITEKKGTVLIINNGQLQPDPFLTLEVDNYNERGLSGIAFDPDFASNGYLYLYYTVKGENHNRISRFTADGNYVLPGSEMVLVNLDPLSGTIHNAGSMAFGQDGKLYISVGDGANAQNAQSLNSLLGKILRINGDGTIPEDNPFFNQTIGVYRAIYALGLRNSFSLSIQPVTGRIFATEVGASTWEEVNEIRPGMNYGWPIIEGPINGQIPPANYKDPVFSYTHDDGCAAVGAGFYNPTESMFPQLYAGKFFFADYCRGYIKYLDPEVPGVATTFATAINRPLNLLVAPDGTMYYLARAGLGGGSEEDNTATDNGTLWRVFYTGSNRPFISVNPQSILISEGEDARFFTAASGEAPLQYQWQRNAVDISGANAAEYIFPNAMLTDSGSLFRCIVSNASGADTTREAELSVTTDQRPEPEILTPAEGTLYRGGDILFFSGRASDPEQGELPPGDLRWKIDFHHNVHTHPALIPTAGITSGEYLIPQAGETAQDVWYKIHLTATDDRGLSKTVTRDVFPVKTQFNIHTIPNGLPLYVDGDFLQSPVAITSVVGIIRQIEVVSSVVSGDSIRIFREWSDGVVNASRTITTSDDTVTLIAIYETIPVGHGTGIRGYYYDSPEFDPIYYEPYEFSWIDTTIDFDWFDGSPAITQLGNDFWLVRWEGFVEPLFDDTYTFSVLADDGIRLWVDDQMLIDAWIPQAPTEWSGSISLEAGKQYPIKLEFYEEGGGAVCRLYWSSDRLSKSIIPKSQLYPERTTATHDGTTSKVNLLLFPNPVRDILHLKLTGLVHAVNEISIHNSLGQEVLRARNMMKTDHVEMNLQYFAKGWYVLKYRTENGDSGAIKFVKF